MTRGQQVFVWFVALLVIGAIGLAAVMSYQGVVDTFNVTLTAADATSSYLSTRTGDLLTAAASNP